MPLTLKNFNSTWWWWWTPWANTIAYFPLTINTSDQVWSHTINYGSVTPSKQMIWYNFTGRATVDIWSNVDRTLACWIKIVSISNSQYVEIATTKKYNIQYYYYHAGNNSLSQKYLTFINNNYDTVEASYTINTDTWYHFCSVADTDNSKMYWYINWVKVVEANQLWIDLWNSFSTFWFHRTNAYIAQNWVATLSQCIIEDKAWTAQEVSDW